MIRRKGGGTSQCYICYTEERQTSRPGEDLFIDFKILKYIVPGCLICASKVQIQQF